MKLFHFSARIIALGLRRLDEVAFFHDCYLNDERS